MSILNLKPIAILEYDLDNGPAYFADYLRGERIPFEHIRIDVGAPVPASIEAFSGLCLMGGSPSVYDDLPWIAPVLALISDAIARDVPVIGHCLGGQLLAKALGGQVINSPEAEIGWGECYVEDSDLARDWFGKTRTFPVFQWHFETFSIPEEAVPVLGGIYCENQAFAYGPHIGLQPHIEVDEAVIKKWADKDRAMLKSLSGPCVQSHATMLKEMKTKLPVMRALTQHVYGVWLGNVLERQV